MAGVRAPRVLAFVASTSIAACAAGETPTAVSGDDASSPELVEDAGPCTHLECQQVDCAARGLPDTTLTGVVYDPAGVMPLYNVFVYVPNGKPEPITPGHPTCSACQAVASGSPLVWTTTDATGTFHLAHVPSGDSIPLVLQAGKWRRQIVVPHVGACTANSLTDPNLVRLPAKSSEGDMPLIALATGCDAEECFLRDVGIDPSEFTGPGGGGHVHVYGGRYAGMVVPGIGDAYALWASSERLAQYDVVMAACECQVFPRDTEGPAYAAMRTYLDGGGRLYTTHYQYNWFAPPTGPADFQSMAEWNDDGPGGSGTFFVDTSFPKGHAFADWLEANHFSPAYGQVNLTDARASVAAVTGATRWVYGAADPTATTYSTKYLSFNTPIGAPVASQCGRATFSDAHVSGESDAPGPFPSECAARTDVHGADERALEFLLFDLVSCIQDDSQPPPPPPTQ